jgi:hypothetical protein
LTLYPPITPYPIRKTLFNESEQKGNKKKEKDAYKKGHRQRGPQRGRMTGMVLEKECQQGKQYE